MAVGVRGATWYPAPMVDDVWAGSRGGSHAGRGFHYQDAVATQLAILAWRNELPVKRLVPEGFEDISLELATRWIHLQAKSRREHRGEFRPSELAEAWRHLAARLTADRTAHAGLVLEQPHLGVETGFERTLADTSSSELRNAIAHATSGLIATDDFLARTHLVVLSSPEERTVELLAERLELPPASCMAHEAVLRTRIGRLADENGTRTADNPAAFSIGEIARLLDDVTEAIDPSALEQAVREGIVELVDFTTATDDGRFFLGVDVVVGHVVAGLPAGRPEVEQLSNGLEARRVALAVGPSGAGKSALIWMTAYANRHNLRWYRVRRLNISDVPALVRLVKGLSPSAAKTGFVIDDLGRDDRAGFDHLVHEMREQAGAHILGACREEDLFVISTASGAAQVRPTLGPELAERIWRELWAREATAWPEWREAYERSEGLLLEYGHLLTEGTRLSETVAAQVARRVREERALELDVLALVTTADAFGAEIDATRLATAIAADATKTKATLARLVNEYLIVERDGFLSGLHELRSRHVMGEVHRLPPPTLPDTLRHVIALVTSVGLQPFLTRLLLENVTADELVIDAVALRLAREPDPLILAASLQAMRLVGFRRATEKWRAIFAEEGAAPNDVGLISHFVLHGGELDAFPEPIQRCVARIAELETLDLRTPLLERIEHQIPCVLAAATDIPSVATVLATLGEVGRMVTVDISALAVLAKDASLVEVRLLLEAAYASSADLAIAFADELGGSPGLLARLEREQPWVRDAHIDIHDDGSVTAEAEYAYVAESAQPRAHDAVVELARYLAALAPSANLAVCRAIDATGKAAGLGMALAEERIDRRYLPSLAEVAWNRARGRAAIAAVATPTETAHWRAARDIIIRSEQVVRRAGNAWARGKQSNHQLFGEAVALSEASNELAPPPIAIEAIGPLEEGDLPLDDPISFLGRLIANNLYRRLFEGAPVASMIPQLVEQVDKATDSGRWDLLDDPPRRELADLRDVLIDLHAAVAERDCGDPSAPVSLKAAGKNGLTAMANVARRRADARMKALAAQLEEDLAKVGFTARVLRRETEPDSDRWPSDDFLVLVHVPTIYDWHRHLATLADLCRPALKDRIGFLMAPIREGHVVASCGAKVIESVFPTDSVGDWPGLPLPLLDERLGDRIRTGLTGLHEASGIVASLRSDDVHEDEQVVLQAAVTRARDALQYVADLAAERDDQLLQEIGAMFLELSQRVEREATALKEGQPVDHSVAGSLLAGLVGDPNEIVHTQMSIVAACVEWDVDPDNAFAKVAGG